MFYLNFITMPLRFGLVENHLTDDPDDYSAMVTDNDTVTDDQIIDDMVERGSTVTKADILSVLEEYGASIQRYLRNGYQVNTDLFRLYPSISGVFHGRNDSFDRSRHQIKLSLNAGSRLKDVVPDIDVQRVEINEVTPVIQRVEDLKTHSVDSDISPGNILSVKGAHLKFDESDPEQGVFFIDESGHATRAENIAKNKPSELLVFVPESLSGSYHIEVRALLYQRKAIRSFRFDPELNTVS
jgi:hypothetical protein